MFDDRQPPRETSERPSGLVMGRIPLPSHLHDVVASPPAAPFASRDAATIAVLRDGPQGAETFLMRRRSNMALAPGMLVFPGGAVDPSDYMDVPWAGPTPEEWAARLGCSPQLARAVVVAAVRETFEEAGVLLAGPDDRTVLSDTSTTRLVLARALLEAHDVSFGEFLRAHHLVLRSDLLGAWGHWIAPDFEPHRFDTRIFVAAIPEGQRVGSISREATKADWAVIRHALDDVERGRESMLPPTIATCREVLAYQVADIVAVAASRPLRTVRSRLVESQGRMYVESYTEGVR